MHSGQYSAVIDIFAAMASFANVVQSAILQLCANFLNQFIIYICAKSSVLHDKSLVPFNWPFLGIDARFMIYVQHPLHHLAAFTAAKPK